MGLILVVKYLTAIRFIPQSVCRNCTRAEGVVVHSIYFIQPFKNIRQKIRDNPFNYMVKLINRNDTDKKSLKNNDI